MNPVLDEPLLESHTRFESSSSTAAGRMNALDHEVHRSFEAMSDMGAEWDAFVERCDGDLYASFDWCRIWWRYYGDGRSLEVHFFRDDGRIVGIIPAFRETLWCGPISIRLLRLLGCDHSTTTCGVVIASEHIEAVIATFSQWLTQDSDWDMVQWSPLAGYFPHRAPMADAFARYGDRWTVRSSGDDGPHIIWELPGTLEEYLAGLTKKERSNIKIGRKKLVDARSIEDSAATPEELQQWFPVFIEQHQKQWRAEGKLGHFADWPGAESFHRELAESMAAKNRLWLLRLDVANQPIGFQYNYRFGKRIHWLLGSRDIDPQWDTFGSGRTLHAETIERAIAGGFTGIDGLRGMYEYKLRLGGKVTGLQSITLVRRGTWIEFKVRFARLYARWLDLLYYRIWFCRMAPRLPLPRRGLWKSWIRSRI